MSTLIRTMESITQADQRSLKWVSGRRHPLLDLMMRGFTRAGDWQSWTAVLVTGLTIGGPFRALGLAITPKLLLTFGICFLIKSLLRRPRPAKTMNGFSALLKDPDPYSFPSSHSACAWVVCASLAIMLGGWPIWMLYAGLISYSRIHVGAHYPLDVLIGSIIGVLVAFLF